MCLISLFLLIICIKNYLENGRSSSFINFVFSLRCLKGNSEMDVMNNELVDEVALLPYKYIAITIGI